MLEFYGTRISHRGKWRVHAFLRSTLRASSDCDLEVTRRGLRWCLNPSDFVQTHLYWTDEYEPWDLLQLSHWVRPGSVVFDVGANFGYYSISLATALQGHGRVFAFEPSKTTFSRLQTNIALNGLESIISAIPCALSDRPGRAYLDQAKGNSGATAVSAQAAGDAIELDTLDHFCQRNKVDRVDIVKVDVEGSELRVIEGGKATLALHQPIVMIEFNSSALKAVGTTIGHLGDLLLGLGYRLLKAKRDRLIPFDSTLGQPILTNVFCIPRTRSPVAQ